jgi:predicted Rossmann-fold nucleotide-binding protein
MARSQLPFDPLPKTLYAPDDLFEGFEPNRSGSYAETRDFQIYRYYISSGKFAPHDYSVAVLEALHDNAITHALNEYLNVASAKSVGVMGGHDLSRDSLWYGKVAELSRILTNKGFTMLSGGGPGAMEATHLGAALAGGSQNELDAAITRLRAYPALPPKLSQIVKPDGTVDESLVEATFDWFKPAYEVAAGSSPLGNSVAIPTWLYGHEPTTPLCPHIGKYFQNSIREDGLTGLATHGVIYAEGRAGTLQEIFQDSAQNYYRVYGAFSPMIFLGADYWKYTYPVEALLKKLFAAQDFDHYVMFTDDIDVAIRFIESHSIPEKPGERMMNYLNHRQHRGR